VIAASALPRGCSRDLQTRFVTHRCGLFTFRHHPEVSPTDNAGERSLRPSMIHREEMAGSYACYRHSTHVGRGNGAPLR
jgi:hypothetical protein